MTSPSRKDTVRAWLDRYGRTYAEALRTELANDHDDICAAASAR